MYPKKFWFQKMEKTTLNQQKGKPKNKNI